MLLRTVVCVSQQSVQNTVLLGWYFIYFIILLYFILLLYFIQKEYKSTTSRETGHLILYQLSRTEAELCEMTLQIE